MAEGSVITKTALTPFEEVAALIRSKKKAAVLLGNGFSQAFRPDIFSYGSLFDKANFDKISPFVQEAFHSLNTTDFEHVIKSLRDAAVLAKVYAKSNPKLSQQLKRDAESLKNMLVETIAEHHPSMPSEISSEQSAACQKFLSYFHKIYTVNYDLLLYWVGMSGIERGDKHFQKMFNDGFLHPESDPTATYVKWGEGRPYDQKVFYIHGALHLFESESELMKYTWSRTGVPLLDQIREALTNEKYPLFVSEGTSQQKRGRILRSEYLGKGLRSLKQCDGSLLIYGLSLSENDSHIIDAIKRSKITEVFISVYGKLGSKSNKSLVARAQQLKDVRSGAKRGVYFFDAESAKVWG